ncbi:MAG: head-tail adaptor protein [Pirellulales bacterium]
MNAGRLRHRGSFQVSLKRDNAAGQSIIEWHTVIRRVACNVGDEWSRKDLGGLAVFGQQLQAETVHLVSLHWRPDITNNMRFIWHDGATDRAMTIATRPYNPDGRKKELLLACKEPQ